MKMRNKNKLSLIAFSAVLAAGFAAGGIISSAGKAKAEELSLKEHFYLEKGASIRLKEGESGIRFSTVVSDEYREYLKTSYGEGATIEYHTIIGAGENYDNYYDIVADSFVTLGEGKSAYRAVIYYDNLKAELEKMYADANKSGDELDNAVNAALQAAYGVELNAKSYVVVSENGETKATIDAYKEDNLRSVRGVALDLLLSGEETHKTELEAYLGGEVGRAESSGAAAYYDVSASLGEMEAGVPAGDYSVYYGAKKLSDVTVNENGDTVTIGGIAGLEEAKDYSVTLYNAAENKAYNRAFKAVTKVLKTASDLEVFKATDDSSEFGGYYVLGNDIDASGYTCVTGVNGSALGAASGRYLTNSLTGDNFNSFGLKGTFDGNGYTISNLTVGSCGMFGVINGGTVKNVALKDVKFVEKQNVATLAWYIIDATIENVYMNAESLPAVWGRAMVASSIYTSTVKNVVIQLKEVLGNTGEKLNVYGGYGAFGSFVSADANRVVDAGDQANVFSDVYVISTTKLSVLSKSQYDGENTEAENKYVGIKRYDSAEEMASARNDYSSFDKSLWSVNEGVLSFRSKGN